uniref:Sialin n=1 Tax=Mola mola TaxID=94237 RepID=A0A3Q3WIJ7_MOLML
AESLELSLNNKKDVSSCCPVRLNLAILMFFGFAVVYALRVNLSVAMVAMVNTTEPVPAPNSSVIHACPLPSGYLWDSETQGWLLGAFFFGYLGTQIPGGYLAGHYGGSMFLGLGVLGTAILTLLTPLAAQLGSHWLFALRALEGFGEGVTFPAMMAMWARWAPPLERSRLMTLSGSGANFGAFVSLPLTGYICQTLGWPSVFYICGGVGCLWALFWFALVYDDPRTHRRISKEECDYIINSIGPQVGHGWSVPLVPMLLSVRLWAIIIPQMCFNWSYYTLFTSLPTYMNIILHFDLKSVRFGFASSSVSSDFLIERRVFSVTVVRKLFTLAGEGTLPAALLVAVTFVGCNHVLTVTFLTLSTTIAATSSCGVFINQIDIAPRWVLRGDDIIRATPPGRLLGQQQHTLAGWKKVFWVAAGINLCGVLVYTIFGSGEIQPWAMTEEEREEAEDKAKRSRSIST